MLRNDKVLSNQELLCRRAENGDADAQCSLGIRYLMGGCGVAQDIEKAKSLLGKAAAQNYAEAQYILGAYIKNDKTSPSFLRKAAAQDHAGAQYQLGCNYEHGMAGVRKNINSAMIWYRKAIENKSDVMEDKSEVIMDATKQLENLERESRLSRSP